jgi:hypothetical protein
LTTTQILGGLLVVDPTTTASTLTLPTATAIDAVMTNMKTNSTFKLTVINIGTSTGPRYGRCWHRHYCGW